MRSDLASDLYDLTSLYTEFKAHISEETRFSFVGRETAIIEDIIHSSINDQSSSTDRRIFRDKLLALRWDVQKSFDNYIELEYGPLGDYVSVIDFASHIAYEQTIAKIDTILKNKKYFPYSYKEGINNKLSKVKFERFHTESGEFISQHTLDPSWEFYLHLLPKSAGYRMRRFLLKQDRISAWMSRAESDYHTRPGETEISDIYAMSKVGTLTADDFDFRSKGLKLIEGEVFIKQHLMGSGAGDYLELQAGPHIYGAQLPSEYSPTAVEALKYINKHYGEGEFRHEDLTDLMGAGPGLVTEPVMSLRTKINGEIRILNGRSDMFSLLFDSSTSTLEIYDFKPEADFDIDNPGSHYINHFMQLIAYALTIQKIVGNEINIRCVVLNQKGFVQFNPHEMYYTLIEFLFNMKQSAWGRYIRGFIKQNAQGNEGLDYRKGYAKYSGISPTDNYKKAFTDLYPLVDKNLRDTDYLEKVEKLLGIKSITADGIETKI